MNVIGSRRAVIISVYLNLLLIGPFFILCYTAYSEYVASHDSEELEIHERPEALVIEEQPEKLMIREQAKEIMPQEQSFYATHEKRILGSFAIRTIPKPPRRDLFGLIIEPYYKNPSNYYGQQLVDCLKGLGFKITDERNPNQTYFTGSPDYLLMRKITPRYNVALSFTSLLTEEQRFFKSTIKFESPEDTEYDENFQLQTNPLKIIHQSYMDTVALDLQEILTAMATIAQGNNSSMPIGKNYHVLFDNVAEMFKMCQECKIDLADVIEIRFFTSMINYPFKWLWVFQVGCDSVTVYSGQPILWDEEYNGPSKSLPGDRSIPMGTTNIPGDLNF
jgi:hypothetical protein